MFAFIAENLATIIISAVILCIIVLIIVSMVRRKKKGQTACGCGCSGCPSSSICNGGHQ